MAVMPRKSSRFCCGVAGGAIATIVVFAPPAADVGVGVGAADDAEGGVEAQPPISPESNASNRQIRNRIIRRGEGNSIDSASYGMDDAVSVQKSAQPLSSIGNLLIGHFTGKFEEFGKVSPF